MKVAVEQTEKKFEPIKLTIVMECEDDVREMWHRFNNSLDEDKCDNTISLPENWYGHHIEIWEPLDLLCQQLNIT